MRILEAKFMQPKLYHYPPQKKLDEDHATNHLFLLKYFVPLDVQQGRTNSPAMREPSHTDFSVQIVDKHSLCAISICWWGWSAQAVLPCQLDESAPEAP
jgi:hypothetical protein